MPRTKVFVSYSHLDHHWLERLRVHLGVLERRELVHLWTDELIEIGAAWEEKIKTALSESKVAVLLISPGFLASDYIWKEEMSHILDHEKEGMKVFPLIVRPCAWKIEEVLKKSQARPAGGRALSMGNEAQVDLDLAAFVYELAERVEQLPETLHTTQERELAEQYQASASLPVVRNRGDQPDQKRSDAEPDRAALATLPGGPLNRLPRSWTGSYAGYIHSLRLIIREQQGNEFQGSIVYLGDETVTAVEGRVEENVQNVVDELGLDVDSLNVFEVPLALRFKETGYEISGNRSIDFDGEYRALASGSSISGAWFTSEGRRLERFALTLDE